MDEGGHGNLDRIGHLFADLITWRDVAKSNLWFGLGCLCFLSSCFTKGVSFSIFSVISQLGLLFLGASFFSNSILQRNNDEKKREFKVKEEDILRFGRLILPATNLAISKTRELFSGEPSKILKVVPFLLLGAEYGHIITMLRLFDLGFFISFTFPKLYSCYSNRINQKGMCFKLQLSNMIL
ncbi:reticulon-like protein B17 [Pistacia vera]|uniref:reticulon-like protein B17 n=1 Tax=Pistacia vera TaxID=55513 RepID=UPI001263561E|nr:reticulon-like protein B17 [Pistacia vera]